MKLGILGQVRWMVDSDIDDVVRIEQQRVHGRQSEQSIRQFRKHKNAISCVIVDSEQNVVGFVLYSIFQGHIHVRRLAVDADKRRQGYGAKLISRLVDKLHPSRRTVIRCDVSELDLEGHLFLQAMGFFAESVRNGEYRFFYELQREGL